MANVIKTVLTYQLDGSTRDFNIPFEYLARKFVVVTLIGVDRKVLTLNTDYRFATRTTISLTKAWGTSDGYTTIELRRVTSTTDRLVDFTDGSILRAYDLNIAQIQTMHVAEEARDLTADTIGVNNDGHLDARGRRIVNLANAVDDRDAVPFGQLKAMNQNSWQARNEALQFRNGAETFRNQAEGFKNESGTNAANTKQWRDEAKGFRDEAEQFKNTAGQYATSAGNSASAARQSEVNAKDSSVASANSAASAEQQADRAEREADKLGNMNDLAGTIESVDKVTNTVTFKGLAVSGSNAVFHTGDTMWVEIIGHIPNKSNWNTNGIRIINRNARTADIYSFESTDNYHSLMFRVYQKGNPDTPEAYYEFRNTGDLATTDFIITKSGRVHGSAYENGFLDDWVRKYFVGDVYLGSETWLTHSGGYQDIRAPSGYVQTGITVQDRGVIAIWARPVWLSYPNGEKRIIVTV